MTLAGQVTVTVAVPLAMVHVPSTRVMLKLVSVPPLTTGTTDPVPAAGPTEAGLSVQTRVPL